jgi:hypothetical protein
MQQHSRCSLGAGVRAKTMAAIAFAQKFEASDEVLAEAQAEVADSEGQDAANGSTAASDGLDSEAAQRTLLIKALVTLKARPPRPPRPPRHAPTGSVPRSPSKITPQPLANAWPPCSMHRFKPASSQRGVHLPCLAGHLGRWRRHVGRTDKGRSGDDAA